MVVQSTVCNYTVVHTLKLGSDLAWHCFLDNSVNTDSSSQPRIILENAANFLFITLYSLLTKVNPIKPESKGGSMNPLCLYKHNFVLGKVIIEKSFDGRFLWNRN